MNSHIRKAAHGDLDGIEAAYFEHFTYEKAHIAYTVFQEGVYPTRETAEKALRQKALYVYEEGGVIAGSMILDDRQPEEYKSIVWQSGAADKNVCVLHLLMVRPCMAGKGIGTALVLHALEMARKRSCTALRLDTGAQNIPAVSLYRSLGFQLAASSSMKVGGMVFHREHLFFEKIL